MGVRSQVLPPQEVRIAQDWNVYRRMDFLEHYGEGAGQRKWDESLTRVAPDSNAYTRAEFLSQYGHQRGKKKWDEASPLVDCTVHLLAPDGSLLHKSQDSLLASVVLLTES